MENIKEKNAVFSVFSINMFQAMSLHIKAASRTYSLAIVL